MSLSLSGGGARGFAHLGALKAIEEFDIQIKAISGTSIGSVIGGMYASGYSTDEIEEFIRDFATSPSVFSDYSRKDIPIEYKFQKNSNIVDLAFENFKPLLPTSLSEDSRINYLLIKAFSGAGLESDNDFKHLKIPLTVVSSDIIQEKPVYFKSGNLAKIIRSSISLPIVLPPIEIDSMFLVDGGVYNNLPVDVFPDSDFVIAINTASQSYAKEQIKSFADITVQMVNILAAKSDSNSLKGWELFIEPEMEDITNTSWNLYQEAITAGYNETYKRLKESGFPLRNDIYSNKSNRLDLENFEIADIEIKGLYRLSKYFIQKELNLNDGDHFSWTNIKAGMNRLYSLKLIRFFWLDFKLTTENKLILTIEIKEENLTRMGIGGYYSNTMGNNIYVSYEMVGRLQQSEVISLEGYIGNYYNGISAKIRLPRLFNWPIFNQLSFTSDQRKYNPLKLSKAFHNTNVLSYDLGLLFDHNMILLGDIKYKRASFDIDSIDSGENFRTFSIGFSYNFETLDDLFFPTNGTSISIQYHFNNTVNVNNKNDVLDYNIFNINIENHNNILRNKFILSQRYKTIFTLSGSIPTLPIIEKTRLDLTRTTLGLFDGDLYGLHHSRLEIILKYNIVSDLFTYTSFVLGKTWNKKSDITFKSLSWDQLDRGAELGLYYPTIIGPILLTYSTDKFFKNQFRLSIGHIF